MNTYKDRQWTNTTAKSFAGLNLSELMQLHIIKLTDLLINQDSKD